MFQGASSPDLCSVYVDLRALRNDRVTLVEKGSPQSLCLMESGKVQLVCHAHNDVHDLSHSAPLI